MSETQQVADNTTASAQKDVMAIFTQLASFAAQNKASDIFINSNSNVAIKIDGRLVYVDCLFEESEVYALIEHIADKKYSHFLKNSELNVMLQVPDVSYFRVNAYRQRNVPGLVMRLIPSQVPDLDDLHLPEPDLLRSLVMYKRGLVIVVGATGNGKSTTLASLIKHRNANSQNHIITIEDPIEFMHENNKSVVIQREVGIDTESYGAALKNSLRQAPDVILIGEIRDSETMQYAMHFAETGHLCLATLHATNSVQAIDRIYNFFPRDQREQLRGELANNLVALVTQRLLPRSDGTGRVMAMEIMKTSAYIQSLIADGNLDKIPEALERGLPEEGLMSFDSCIFDLYEEGIINYQDAMSYVESENDFRQRIRAKSKRRLPPELQTSGTVFTVKSDEELEREMLRKAREERERARANGKSG